MNVSTRVPGLAFEGNAPLIEDMTKRETHISTVRRHGAVAERRKYSISSESLVAEIGGIHGKGVRLGSVSAGEEKNVPVLIDLKI